ncbi:MAG TPA: ATP-binding cassette domain-containing protein [Holophagaceae bacterium]
MLLVDDLALDAPDGRPLFAGLHLSVEPGENLLVLGPGGCGKSQLLRALAGTLRPRTGRVRIGEVEVWPGEGAFSLAGRVRLGFVFAQGGLLSNQTLRDNVMLPLRFAGVAEAEAAACADRALARFGLAGVADRRPHAVSAGDRKLGGFARVVALDPALLLLDDPLEGVEAGDRATVLDLIRDWAMDPARTLLLALEEPGPFASLPARRLHLAPGGATPSDPELP